MQRPRTEARFAVGSRAGARSTIWKAWVQGEEAYIASRMFGSDLKVSLHSTGVCQWSCTDTWVLRQPKPRNADRHIVRWEVTPPSSDQALLVFRVDIPISELRLQAPPKDKKKVFWVSGAPEGSTVRFLVYLTRPAAADPAEHSPLPNRHLFSLHLRNDRWLVVLFALISLSTDDLAKARTAVLGHLCETGHKTTEDHRVSLFLRSNEGGPNGLLELCLTEV